MQALYIPIAKWQGEDISPEEFRKRSAEFQHRAALTCPHGHPVFFRAPEGKRCHFVHNVGEKVCTYNRKYPGGESKAHIQGKLYFAERQRKGQPIEFNVLCTQRCGSILSSEKVDPTWTYTTEFKLSMEETHIWADGVFLDGEEVKLVVEIFHTHKVGGRKLRWLQEQPFSFYEVSADLPADGKIPILNQSGGLGTCSECQTRREEADQREALRSPSWEAEVNRRKAAERRKRVDFLSPTWYKEAARKEEERLEKERLEKRRVRQEARAKRDLKVRGEKERKDREISRRKQQVARRKRDQALPEEVIQEEVRRIRQEVGSFEDLHPMEKARAIVQYRSFVSQRVNRILWGYGDEEVPKKKPTPLFH